MDFSKKLYYFIKTTLISCFIIELIGAHEQIIQYFKLGEILNEFKGTYILLISILASYFFYELCKYIKQILLRKAQSEFILFIYGFYLALILQVSVFSKSSYGNTFWVLTFIVISIFLCLLPGLIYLRNIRKNQKTKNEEDELIPDECIEDILEFSKDANAFAEIIAKSRSRFGFVFGLDAPWGTGKTTYLSLCEKYWEKEHPNNIVVTKFEHFPYESGKEIFYRFVEEFKKILEVENFAAAKNAFSSYVKNASDLKLNLGLFTFNLNKPESRDNISNKLLELKREMEKIDKKIIIIIDDLDRSSLKEIKLIFDMIKKTFDLPNVNYIVCYDTQVLHSISEKSEVKIVKYLEKIINIKKTIILDKNILKGYFSEKLKGKFPSEAEEINIAAEYFFDQHFYEYVNLLGDLRKLKILINILRIQVKDPFKFLFRFNFIDLVNLVLIYIYFPKNFRDIYISEVQLRKKIFTLEISFKTRAEVRYTNVPDYTEYIEKCDPNAVFLIKNIFSAERIERKSLNQYINFACFNTEMHPNLENYLRLILTFEKSGRLSDDEVTKDIDKNIKLFLNRHKSLEAIVDEYYTRIDSYHAELYISRFFQQIAKNYIELKDMELEELIAFIATEANKFPLARHQDIYTSIRGILFEALSKITNELSRAGNSALYKFLQGKIINCFIEKRDIETLYSISEFAKRIEDKSFSEEIKNMYKNYYESFFNNKNIFQLIEDTFLDKAQMPNYHGILSLEKSVILQSIILDMNSYWMVEDELEESRKSVFNKYLFEVCFDPNIGENNAKYFVDFFLLFAAMKSPPLLVFRLKDYSNLLDIELLKTFWLKNSEIISIVCNQDLNRQILRYRTITYKDCFQSLKDFLDSLISSSTPSPALPTAQNQQGDGLSQ